MSVHHLGATVLAALATPAAAHTLTPTSDPTTYGLTADRLWAAAAALLAIGSVILGGWILARSVRRAAGSGRKPAALGLGVALFALVNGVLVVVTADGGPGSGNGIVGGYIAAVLGLAAMILNGLVLIRTRFAQSR